MRAWIFSDLHLPPLADIAPPSIPPADIALVAGDVCDDSHRALRWLADYVRPAMPVVFVLGNHELYHANFARELVLARRLASECGIHLLEHDVLQVAGLKILGTTLWTDYALYAGDDPALRARHMDAARKGLSDHSLIYWTDNTRELFTPEDARQLHLGAKTWLTRNLGNPGGGATVVVTHHAPHPKSVHPQWVGHILTPAFVSDMTELIEGCQPDLWVHGHTHANFDYQVGRTRIICNPGGYRGENPVGFRWDLVVDI